MWMTMHVPNNLGLNLTSMVLMVLNATMVNNKAILNIFIKLKSNHNMMHHVWRIKSVPKRTIHLKAKHKMESHSLSIKNGPKQNILLKAKHNMVHHPL
jgi:hypothetical protein